MLQALISGAGLLLALVGLPILIVQLRELQRSVRGGAHAAIYAQASEFRAHLVEHPRLRKYLFDGAEITPDHPDGEEYDRVLSLAELYLNYLEHVTVMADSFGKGNRPVLDRFVTSALAASPVMRRRLSEQRDFYSPALARRLPTGD
jgi:hypothetical protein